MVTRVRALAFPVFQKDWLYFTLQVVKTPDADAPGGSSNGTSSWSFFRSLQTRIEKEWKLVQDSKPGTFKSIVRRCALSDCKFMTS
jgi:hypothetical protein